MTRCTQELKSKINNVKKIHGIKNYIKYKFMVNREIL